MNGRWGSSKRGARSVGVVMSVLLVAAGMSAGDRRGFHQSPTLTPQTSGTTNRLQAVSPVSSRVVWASGVGGTFARTTDGGQTWESHVVPGAETLEFRDVEGVSANVAYLLASGVGSDSRIYKTEDGGATWELQFQNADPNGFYDCFAFWTPRSGLTMADSSNGRFPVVRTFDGGKNWKDIGDKLPAPLPDGEYAFAASGTCVAALGLNWAWIAAASTTESRIFATRDFGQTWNAYTTPIAASDSGAAGVFSVAFRDPRHGVIGGGDFLGEEVIDNFARSRDGGKTWSLESNAPIPGAIFGLAYVGDLFHWKTIVATGPGGAAWTPDEGDTWTSLEGVDGYWAVAFAPFRGDGWLVGTDGRILKISF